MPQLESFIDPSSVSLKICGVRTRDDAERLVAMGVDALGVNFWPKSKRYLNPEDAEWLREMSGKILRVGVFVNEAPELPLRLLREGYLDAVQLHGDETPADAAPFRDACVPFFKAIGVTTRADLDRAAEFGAAAILLDAAAPGVYGGTGHSFDWKIAADFVAANPTLPVILAGGVVPSNAALAVATVRPVAIDVASGAELAPGIKDFDKVAELLTVLRR